MNSGDLLYWAIFVFVMMLIGLGLTVIEFRNKSGVGDSKSEVQPAPHGAVESRTTQE